MTKFAEYMVIATIFLMNILTGTEFDLFVPSFPELQEHFSLTPFLVELLLSVNFAGFCLSLFFVGALGDRFGRKPIILLGLIIFTIGSVLCLWALSYEFMLLGRFLQGVGIAAPTTLSFLIIADSYPINKQQFLFAMLNGLCAASGAAAPVVGSYITLYFHWQGNFTALLVLGLLTLVLTVIFIPMTKLPEHKETLSLRGYIPIFQSAPMLILIIYFVCNLMPYWIFVGMSPLLYMKSLGVSLPHFGLYQGVFALVFAIGTLFFSLIVNRYDQKKMLYLANLIFIFGFISLALVSFFNSRNPLFITLAFIPFIIGQIIPSNILYPIYLNLMPQAKGRASAVLQGGRLIFSALSLQIAGYFYNGSFQNIGMIMCIFIILSVIALFFVIKKPEIMHFTMESK